MFFLPTLIGDRRIDEPCAQIGVHRHGQPARSMRGFDLIAILYSVLLILHDVEIDEDVGAISFVEVRQPRQILWLVNGDRGHAKSSSATSAPLSTVRFKRLPTTRSRRLGDNPVPGRSAMRCAASSVTPADKARR